MIATEKILSLSRAISLFIITFITQFFFKLSSSYFDIFLLCAIIFTFTTLVFPPANTVLSLTYNLIDVLLLTALVKYSGGISSPFVVFYIPLLVYISYRFGLKTGIIFCALSSAILYLFSYKSIIYSNYVIIVLLFTIATLISLVIRQEIDIKNYLKLLELERHKLSTTTRTIQHLQHRILQEQVFDYITELYNTKYFLLRLEEELSKAKRYKFPFSVAILGVDNFRIFNSRYGEKKSNEALKIIATLLKAYFRHSDLLARQDRTDKFLLILPYTSGYNAKIPIERFREAVRKYIFDEKDVTVRITISVGIACFPQDGKDERSLLERAELALRRAKLSGKDSIFFASEPKEECPT